MKLEIRVRGVEAADALREHAARRVHFHLSRFGHEVAAVVMRISDLNGPKGGIDKRCQITVTGPRLGSATLDDRSSDAHSAVDLSVERISRAIGRELERARTERRAKRVRTTG